MARAWRGCDCREEFLPGIHLVPLGACSWLWPVHCPMVAVAETLSLPCHTAEKAAVLLAGLGDLRLSPHLAENSSLNCQLEQTGQHRSIPRHGHQCIPSCSSRGLGRGNAAVGTRCVPMFVPCCHLALAQTRGCGCCKRHRICGNCRVSSIQMVQL